MRELIDNVIGWATERDLIDGTNERAGRQMMKVMSELGEFADEVAKGDQAKQIDELGDVIVTLIVCGKNLGIDIEDALEVAYTKIKHRKGKMVGGVFVKDGA